MSLLKRLIVIVASIELNRGWKLRSLASWNLIFDFQECAISNNFFTSSFIARIVEGIEAKIALCNLQSGIVREDFSYRLIVDNCN